MTDSNSGQFSPMGFKLGFLYGICCLLLQSPPASAAGGQESPDAPDVEEPTGRLYITSSERRESGLKHEVTSWLTASFLLELEGEAEVYHIRDDNGRDKPRSGNATLQVGLVATPWESVKAELILEYETDTEQLIADEAFVGVELDDWEIEAGRMYTAFGVYISHFATGPLLELGETRADVITLSYGPSDQLDFSIAAYQGNARKTGENTSLWDWTLAFEAWPSETVSVGMSYQSDLADSDEQLLEDADNRYSRKVPGLSAYGIWSLEKYEVSFEALGALRSYSELEHDRNQPLAWNLEFAQFFSKNFEWALRVEGSHELEDAPEIQYGISGTWRPWKNSTLTLEYLRGNFKDTLAVSEDDESYDRVETLAAQFSIIF